MDRIKVRFFQKINENKVDRKKLFVELKKNAFEKLLEIIH